MVMAGLLLGGCASPGEGTTIDGWPIGALQTCPVPNVPRGAPYPTQWDCQLGLSQWVAAAIEGFDRRDPGHAAIVRTTIHDESRAHARSGGCCKVAVFELADGSIRAIGVGHPGIETEQLTTVDFGP